jgi:predicted dehydrogenase
VYDDVQALVRDSAVDAVWVLVPNFVHVEIVEAVAEEVTQGRAQLVGLCCEKPLGRNVAEARQIVATVQQAGLLHGYLENQVFAPGVVRGRELLWARAVPLTGAPYLARSSEEHAGPHGPLFWSGELQGGGVAIDMMCHTIEATRHLLSKPGSRDWLRPRAITASMASLKWTRPRYAEALRQETGGQVDYTRTPAEDYAHVQIVYETQEGETAVAEASSSWSFVGAGLRLSCEVLGPEYSMAWNTLDTELRLFLSRAVHGEKGEDMIEKQNAEQGLLPVLVNEATSYGYIGEDRHMVQAFLAGWEPEETFEDGLFVTEMVMSAYAAAESGSTLRLPIAGLDEYRPPVARGAWRAGDMVASAREYVRK